MRDSILKGTGNSRFLKSAVPAGTSWADALAMLQAGTFPIDFNGINNAGFQQVGTPLNKANLLKDVNALTLGLPGTAVPDDMFNVLAHAGDLHVWRKTAVTKDPIPAGYTLGERAKLHLARGPLSGGVASANKLTIGVMDSIKVSASGEITPGPTTEHYLYPGDVGSDASFSGKFIFISSIASNLHLVDVQLNEIYYLPPDATLFDEPTSYYEFIAASALQTVTGYPLTPAGTTTTYPVSTNRNAYQEGNDAKPAGYTLGEVVTGKFRVSSSYVQGTAYWNYGTSLTVSDDGTVNIANPSSVSLSGSSSSVASNAQQMAGKYAICTSVSDAGYEPDFPIGTVVFFPSDTLFTRLDASCWASKYQPVTGYAAIPAKTTIEYLGCLGDKASVQVVSYVGTGTYGSSNPCSLTFDFAPSVVRLLGEISRDGSFTVCRSYPVNANYGFYSTILFTKALTTIYAARLGFSKNNYTDSYCKISQDGKTVTWYNNGSDQINTAGYTYYFLAIG